MKTGHTQKFKYFLLSSLIFCLSAAFGFASSGSSYTIVTGNELLSGGGVSSSATTYSQDDSFGLIGSYATGNTYANASGLWSVLGNQPTGSVTVNSLLGSLDYTNRQVTLSFSASDPDYTIVSFNISNTANVYGTWYDVADNGMAVAQSIATRNFPWTLIGADNGRMLTVNIRFRNSLGVVGGPEQSTINFDAQEPTINSFEISTTNTVFRARVTLNINAADNFSSSGLLTMLITGNVEDTDVVDEWIIYSTEAVVTLTVQDGENRVTISVRDEAGNVTEAADTIIFDLASPNAELLSITPSVNLGIVTGSVTVRGTITDNVGISSWNLQDDSGQVLITGNTTTVNGILTENWDTSVITEGVRTIVLTAENLQGLIASTSFTVTVDHRAPTPVITTVIPSVNLIVSGSAVTVYGTITDNISGMTWTLEDDSGQLLNSGSTPTENGILTENWDVSTVTEGVRTLTLTLTDTAEFVSAIPLRLR